MGRGQLHEVARLLRDSVRMVAHVVAEFALPLDQFAAQLQLLALHQLRLHHFAIYGNRPVEALQLQVRHAAEGARR